MSHVSELCAILPIRAGFSYLGVLDANSGTGLPLYLKPHSDWVYVSWGGGVILKSHQESKRREISSDVLQLGSAVLSTEGI